MTRSTIDQIFERRRNRTSQCTMCQVEMDVHHAVSRQLDQLLVFGRGGVGRHTLFHVQDRILARR